MSNWKDWEDRYEALGEIVLVRFQFSDGTTHIEDAEIVIPEEGDYLLFDGESYNVKVTPIEWMYIPE